MIWQAHTAKTCIVSCPWKTSVSQCHLPINLTLSRNNQQNHLRSSHQSCCHSKPNNDKLEKAGWVSHWCIYQGRTSSNTRAQSNRDTVAENTVWLLIMGALQRLYVDLEGVLKSWWVKKVTVNTFYCFLNNFNNQMNINSILWLLWP